MSRELDDAILSLRINQLDLGLWIFRTEGDRKNILAIDSALFSNRGHWFVREVIGMMRRTFARIDVTSRSLYALVEPGTCFAGSLLELALAADRVYMLDDPQCAVALSEMNFGGLEDGKRPYTRWRRDSIGDRIPNRPSAERIGDALGPRRGSRTGLGHVHAR